MGFHRDRLRRTRAVALKMPLAIDSYQRLRALGDEVGLLNLAWTLDERDCLGVDLRAHVARELTAELDEDLPYIERYFVQDPYGEELLAQLVARYFTLRDRRFSLTCGAGVSSLLHALARLVEGGPAYLATDVYPDFPLWVERSGASCVTDHTSTSGADHAASARAAGASLVFLERPCLTGEGLADPHELRALCEYTPDAVVLVDESNANYCPPAFSAINLAPAPENLIVLRGLSKGYGLGGLRLGYCVASRPLGKRVRSVVPPLLASSLSLRIGAAVLGHGDITAPLRERIHTSKHTTRALLKAAGIEDDLIAGAPLPYLLFGACAEHARASLDRVGILGKTHLVWSTSTARVSRCYRISVPLSPPRIDLLRERLTLAARDGAGPVDQRIPLAARAPARCESAGCTSPSDLPAKENPS
jgi:histidinol-phosphate/aromatic aminotransferase/cobyric acid decarboxylase-like protein